MPIRQFNLFHLSLVPIREPNFDTLRDLSREMWLRKILSNSFKFPYYGGNNLYWVPQESIDGLVVGIIEKSQDRLQHLPPEKGGAEISREEWQGAYVIIDPTHHEDGQKMAVEKDLVGTPETMVRYLAKYINSRSERPFELEPALIFDSDNFYTFLEENGPLLNWVKFHFVVPNMWDTAGTLDEELKETGEETGTEELDVTFKSRRGLRGDAQRVTEGVDYAARGAGSVRAKSTTGRVFRSDKSPTTTQIEIDDDTLESYRSDWIRSFWKRILGRGQ